MNVNQLEARYGARRKAIDRRILAECERALNEPQDSHLAPTATQPAKNDRGPSAVNFEERRRIALAFGRPIAR